MLSALLIALREGLEAALIVGILLSYLRKTNARARSLHAWAGVASAVLLSTLLAVGMRWIGAQLETPLEQIFEGTTMLLAVAILTWMIFWMRYQARFIKSDLERKMAAALTGGQAWGLFALAFLAVFREGLETALFLAANAFTADGTATLTGALTGLLIAAGIGALIYGSAVRLNLSLFFNVTSLFLIVFAAGLAASGIHEYQEIGWLPILTAYAWDTHALLTNESALGSLLRALVGYDATPSMLQVLIYLGYWIVVVQAARFWTRRWAARLGQGEAYQAAASTRSLPK